MTAQNPRKRLLTRAAVVAGLLCFPATTMWNLAAERIAPKWTFRILQLAGVTEAPPPVLWSLRSMVDHTFQAAVARAVTEAMPLRPLLIRINNEIRYSAFGYISVPEVAEGDHAQLVERAYISEYCSRGSETAELKARDLIPKLRDIQAYYETRNRIFLYLITPSKVAHLPEHFVHRFPCNNSEEDRAMKIPRLVQLLREAGINVLDTASLVHALKGREQVDLFPRGGIHWNRLAVAHALDAVTAEVNRLASRPLVPRIVWSYEIINRARGIDHDLGNLLNLLIPRIWYKTPRVTFRPSAPCDGQPATSLNVALIGSSFVGELAQVMIPAGCLSHLYAYLYLTRLRYGGVPETWKPNPEDKDIVMIRDADIVIVEENEGFALESNYIVKLRSLVSGRYRQANCSS